MSAGDASLQFVLFLIVISLPPEDYQRLCNYILQELDMALNHTHDILNKTCQDDLNNVAIIKTSSSDVKESNNHGDLLEGRTLLEVEALLIMMITRMKIKG